LGSVECTVIACGAGAMTSVPVPLEPMAQLGLPRLAWTV